MNFSIKKAFRESWNMFFSRAIFRTFVLTSLLSVLGLYLIMGIVTFLASFLISQGLLPVFGIVVLAALYGMSYLILVTLNLPLQTYKTGKVDLRGVFRQVWNWKLILRAVAVILLVGVLAFGGAFILSWLGSKLSLVFGIILGVVWVVFVAVRLAFALYILIEAHTKPFSALRDSHEMMKGHGWKFLLFMVILSCISIIIQIVFTQISMVSATLGNIITILFGILIAPWFSLVTTSPYIQIKKS